MAETKIENTETPEVPVEKTSRLKSFRVNHPRTARVAGVIALTGAVLGTVTVLKNRRQAAVETESSDSEASLESSS